MLWSDFHLCGVRFFTGWWAIRRCLMKQKWLISMITLTVNISRKDITKILHEMALYD
jgi:hypothetical protein